MVKVYLPASFRSLTEGTRTAEFDAKTVDELINRLDERFPGLRQRLCHESGLKPGIAVAIDSRICSHGIHERLNPGDEVHFLPSVSGG